MIGYHQTRSKGKVPSKCVCIVPVIMHLKNVCAYIAAIGDRHTYILAEENSVNPHAGGESGLISYIVYVVYIYIYIYIVS